MNLHCKNVLCCLHYSRSLKILPINGQFLFQAHLLFFSSSVGNQTHYLDPARKIVSMKPFRWLHIHFLFSSFEPTSSFTFPNVALVLFAWIQSIVFVSFHCRESHAIQSIFYSLLLYLTRTPSSAFSFFPELSLDAC